MSQLDFQAAVAEIDARYLELCKNTFLPGVKLSTEEVEAFNAKFARLESERAEAAAKFFASQCGAA